MKLKSELKNIGLNKLKPNNLLNTFRVLNNQAISLRWCPSNNWGDAINPHLISRIIDKPVYHSSTVVNIKNDPIIYGIGSIISLYNDKRKVIWGSGLISRDEKVENIERILAVRGFYSGKLLGYSESNYGDPAILTSKYFKPINSKKEYEIGIVPHYTEYSAFNKIINDPEILIIDITSSIQNVINEINKCHLILSSSLHGLVLSDSFQIPNTQVKISGKLSGGQFKFQDYCSGINRDYNDPVEISDILTIRKAVSKVKNNSILVQNYTHLETTINDYIKHG